MKTCFLKLSLTAAGAVLASHAFAADAPAASAAPVTVAANTTASKPAPLTRMVVAAGSVLVLVDGVVANARIAQIHPPAAGFVYER